MRSPLADNKDGPADAEERSESTAEDSTEERESLEESERSLRSDEEDDSSEAGARHAAEKTEGTESSTLLTALVVQCKVLDSPHAHTQSSLYFYIQTENKRAASTAVTHHVEMHFSFILLLQEVDETQ